MTDGKDGRLSFDRNDPDTDFLDRAAAKIACDSITGTCHGGTAFNTLRSTTAHRGAGSFQCVAILSALEAEQDNCSVFQKLAEVNPLIYPLFYPSR
jgi:hypothetical protein